MAGRPSSWSRSPKQGLRVKRTDGCICLRKETELKEQSPTVAGLRLTH